MENVVIIGSGPAGYTAAIYLARANLKPLVVYGNMPGGMLTQTFKVENFPGFPQWVKGYDLMENMRQQAQSFGALFKHGNVVSVDFSSNEKKILYFDDNSSVETKTVIIATGSTPKKLDVPGEKDFMGVSYCAICDGAFFNKFKVAVVGGGDSALEEALYMCNYATEVHLIHRRDKFRASEILSDRVLNDPQIKVHWNSTVESINGAGGRVCSITLKTNGEKNDLECSGVFIAIGSTPNTEAFKSCMWLRNGYIVTYDDSPHTDVPGVFAAGNCADSVYRQAIVAAGMGCKAAINVEKWLNEYE